MIILGRISEETKGLPLPFVVESEIEPTYSED